MEREAGNLVQGRLWYIKVILWLGQREIIWKGDNYDYFGELDRDNNACGYGVVIDDEDPNYKFKGTYFSNTVHGLSKKSSKTFVNFRNFAVIESMENTWVDI